MLIILNYVCIKIMCVYVYVCMYVHLCNICIIMLNCIYTYIGARHIPTFYNNYVIVDKEGQQFVLIMHISMCCHETILSFLIILRKNFQYFNAKNVVLLTIL